MADRWTRIWWVRPVSRRAVIRVVGAGRVNRSSTSVAGPGLLAPAGHGHPGRSADRPAHRRVDHARTPRPPPEHQDPVDPGHLPVPELGHQRAVGVRGAGHHHQARGAPVEPVHDARAVGVGPDRVGQRAEVGEPVRAARGPACRSGGRPRDGRPARRACPPRSDRRSSWTTSKATEGSRLGWAPGRLRVPVDLQLLAAGAARCSGSARSTPSTRIRPPSIRALTADRDRSATRATALSTRTPSRDIGISTVTTLTSDRGPADQRDQEQARSRPRSRHRPH